MPSILPGALAADLDTHRGRAVVLAGRRQPAELHALCHWINQQLKAPVDFIDPTDPITTPHGEALHALAREIAADSVQTLIVLADNPVYDAPGDLPLAEAFAAVPFSAHLSLYDNETSAACQWHLPLSHPFESWSDLRAFEGTASIVQPLIRPLYDTRTAHELVAFLNGSMTSSAYERVRATWQQEIEQNGDHNDDFDGWWRQTLQDGVVPDSAAKPISINLASLPQITPGTAAASLH